MILRYVGRRLPKLHTWDKDVATVEWCEKNVYMHSDSSPLTGMIRFDDTPHIEEVLNDSDRPEVWKQLLNWSTQTGKTLSLQCAWAKSMCTDPTRMQWSIKNNNDIEDYLDEKILPFVRGVKPLQEKLVTLAEDRKKKTRAKSMNVYGGGTTFTGTTAAERRSKSVKYLFCDEIALYGKGHFLELEGRTKAYERHFRKIMAVSSRKYDGDEMDTNYSTCEAKKEWQTWCSSCDQHFYAESKHFKFMTVPEYLRKEGLTEEEFNLQRYTRLAVQNVYVECPHCGYHISNSEKDQNIYDRKYKFVIVDGEADGKTIGYKANALAVRITSFENIATLLINAEYEGDIDVLHQLYIDYFNEFYSRPVETVSTDRMLLLSSGYPELTVPKGAIKGYMCVDTQKDHFWVSLHIFSYGRVNNMVYATKCETFGELEDLWLMGQNLENGFMISKMGIDRRGFNESGVNRTAEVDAFVEYMVSKYKNGDENRIYATEGHSALTGDRAISVVNSRDLSNNRNKIDIKILKFSNIYLKNVLSRSIERGLAVIDDPELGYASNLFLINNDEIRRSEEDRTAKSYISQMTSEVFDYAKHPKTGKVASEKSWVRVRKDNHWWDTAVISEAFAEMDKIALAVSPSDEGLSDVLGNIFSIA